MYFHVVSFLLALPVLSASFRQEYLHSCADKVVRPAWQMDNDLNIVPLIKPARQGVVPVAAEEGLIAAGTSILFSNHPKSCPNLAL
jgi:hypothetical protein